MSAHHASTSAIAARAAAGDSGLPRANAIAPAELRANSRSSNGSGRTDPGPARRCRPANHASWVTWPSPRQDTRHIGRSHPTATLTCASSVDHTFAPSARLTRAASARP